MPRYVVGLTRGRAPAVECRSASRISRIMATCGVRSSGTTSTSGWPSGSYLRRGAAFVRRDQVDAPLRAPVVVAAHHQPARSLARDQRRDGVEESRAQRVDGAPVGRGDRRGHTEIRAKPHAGAVEQQEGADMPSSCQGARRSRRRCAASRPGVPTGALPTGVRSGRPLRADPHRRPDPRHVGRKRLTSQFLTASHRPKPVATKVIANILVVYRQLAY